MEDEKWIQNIRNRMDDYSEPLPPDMWRKLEKDLNVPKVIPLWKRWQFVAAAAMIAVVFSVGVWFWTSPMADSLSDKGKLAQQEEQAVLEDNKPFIPVNESENLILAKAETNKDAEDIESEDIESVSLASQKVLEENIVAAPEVVKVENIYAEQPSEMPQSMNKADTKEDDETEKRMQLLRATRKADREQVKRNAYWTEKNTDRKEQKWQMGLAAGNTPYSFSNSFGGFGRMVSHAVKSSADGLLMNPLSNETTAYNQVLFNNREQSSKTEVHHRMPVSVGASFKWLLNKDWAIETGLFYTLLSSNSHSGSDSYMEEEWKLHYIGIPLKVHRSLWQNERFNFYVSAGGVVEKCVSGSLETVYVTGSNEHEKINSSLDVDPLQWSVTGAVGAQVNFTRQIGLYIEPGIAYYFDDGSDIETFRKEHPLNFNLQLGLRFSFSK